MLVEYPKNLPVVIVNHILTFYDALTPSGKCIAHLKECFREYMHHVMVLGRCPCYIDKYDFVDYLYDSNLLTMNTRDGGAIINFVLNTDDVSDLSENKIIFVRF